MPVFRSILQNIMLTYCVTGQLIKKNDKHCHFLAMVGVQKSGKVFVLLLQTLVLAGQTFEPLYTLEWEQKSQLPNFFF